MIWKWLYVCRFTAGKLSKILFEILTYQKFRCRTKFWTSILKTPDLNMELCSAESSGHVGLYYQQLPEADPSC